MKPKIPIFAILIVALVAVSALAQPLVISPLPDGVYVLTIENGQATLTKATLLGLGDTPTPDPKPEPEDPDDTDPPADLTALTAASQAAYEAIPDSPLKAIHALVVSSVYSAAADQLRDGRATPASVVSDIRALQGGLPDAWQGWVKAVNGEIEKVQNAGLMQTEGQWADAMEAVAEGLPAQAVDDVDAALLEGRPFLRALLSVLRGLGEGGLLGPQVQVILQLLSMLG